ncbi:Rubrerythrin [Oleidesulfovibrio alaskensis G20]|jgi:rubrerythrin|uniref:Rubrerythrin n=1 Tax=Oleidesulfovibrio alaskensis (strain ATCC BAA-1058 / DSM 17464 / G20) TaxID=207559 RepID=Q312X3_OLEA2|nr:rubrerythrin family protein [Oleidesulfovibrio alaskensis]ABB38023.1 Rubrerythrin [Oleidesulfovibrio alaskensis G20]MBG0774538.1 rubrerythrin family protein [Oleidesulfovibrio alaskensis]
MKSLKGTRTEKNILTAFAGESQARNRYDYFAGQARKDGYVQIAHVFEETALHEKAHAKRLFKFLEGGEVTISAGYPAGVIGSTLDNLFAAAEGEHHEYEQMYPEFAAIAKEEGFDQLAKVFMNIAVAEQYHERRFLAFAHNIEKNVVFQRPQTVVWRCRNCGYNHEGSEAPDLCPACAHPKAFFELFAPEW